jgi:puromycin-sensitive aminopeptidase
MGQKMCKQTRQKSVCSPIVSLPSAKHKRDARTQGTNLKASSAPAPAGGSAGQFRGQARLPRFAAPRRYELHLRPDLVAFTFSGSVAIAVAVSASTRFLVLNTADLSVDRASIRFQVTRNIENKRSLEALPC